MADRSPPRTEERRVPRATRGPRSKPGRPEGNGHRGEPSPAGSLGAAVAALRATSLTSPALQALVLAAACLVPLTWYQPGSVIAVQDYNNPLDPDGWIGKIFSGWDGDNLGQPSIREVPLLFPYLFMWRAGQVIGFSAGGTQKLWFVFLFGLAAVSMWTLIRRIAPGGAGWAGVVVVLAYLFNPFTTTSWAIGHNVQFLAYACAPLWIAKLLAVWQGSPSLTSGLGPALASLLFASAFNNPPIILTMIVFPAVVTGGVMLAARKVSVRPLILGSGSVLLWMALLHAWWWLPMAWALLGGSGYQYAGASWDLFDYPGIVTPVPFGDLLRGLGFWEMYVTYYGEPYFPWAASYQHPLLVMATAWLVAAALVPMALRRKARSWAVLAVLLVMAGIFFSKGINPPFGEVNRWLYENVPGFYLLRGTYEKFGPLTFLGVSLGLISLLLWRRPGSRSRSYLALATVVAVFLAGWPLFTGDVASTLTGSGVRANAKIPAYYQRLERWTRWGVDGSMLVVPQSPIGYVKTTWGYIGIDLIQNYSSVPVVMGWPEARPRDGPRFRAFLSLSHAYDQPMVLQRHGISHVLVRHDIDPRPYPGTAEPSVVEARLRRGGFVFERAIGEFRIYRSPLPVSRIRLHGQLLGERVTTGEGVSRPGDVTWARTGEGLPAGLAPTWCVPAPRRVDPAAGWIESECPIDGTVQIRPVAPYRFSFTTSSRRGHVNVHLDPIPTVVETAGSRIEVQPAGFDVEFDTGLGGGAVRLGDALFPVSGGGAHSVNGTLSLVPGAQAQTLQAEPGNLVGDGSFEESMWDGLYALDGRPTGEIAALQSLDATDGIFSLEFHAEGEKAFTSRLLSERVEPGGSYLLSFDYRNVEGGPAGFGVREMGTGAYTVRKLDLEPAGKWRHVQVVIDPSPGAERLRVELYTLASPGARTIVRYDHVRVRNLAPVSDVDLPDLEVPPAPAVTLPPGGTIRLPTSGGRTGLVEDGSFEEGLWNGANDKLAGGRRGMGLTARPSPDTVHGDRSLELVAAGGGAYTSRLIEQVEGQAVYRLSFDYKNVSEGSAGFGVWELGTERYAIKELTLPHASTWQHTERLFVPSAEASDLGLFLYSFAAPDGPAVNRFDNVEVSAVPLPSTVLLVKGEAAGVAEPILEVAGVTETSAAGTIRGLAGTAWLVVPQAYDPGWRLELRPLGDGRVRVARHTTVDGFANGWLIEGSGDAVFAVVYRGPHSLAVGFLVTAIGAAVAAGLGLRRQRREGRRRRWLVWSGDHGKMADESGR